MTGHERFSGMLADVIEWVEVLEADLVKEHGD